MREIRQALKSDYILGIKKRKESMITVFGFS